MPEEIMVVRSGYLGAVRCQYVVRQAVETVRVEEKKMEPAKPSVSLQTNREVDFEE
jgi:hypothetical protein